ncbi:MAG TPA: amidohydrolase family protein [Mycobacteriales bacterium]|nr:amidohydrolase family protein [Mycobacteriales bacterium]
MPDRVPARPGPVDDAAVPRFWRELGLPGLVDVHVHFLPPAVLAKVWAFFDAGEEHYGVRWPITYRMPEVDRVAALRAMGVRAFTALAYPHRPGMAEWLNGWTGEFTARTPDAVPSATFYPEPHVVAYVVKALDRGVRVFKAHVTVGDYDPRDRLLDPVWGVLAEAGVPVVVHCGSGPRAGRFTGPAVIGEVLARHPRLTLVVAHLGAPEYAEHLALAERYRNVHLDTTMAGTDFMERLAPLPAGLRPRLAALADRIVLGSDFPNIPYSYAHQLQALVRWDLGQDWLRAVLWDNGTRLLGLPVRRPGR